MFPTFDQRTLATLAQDELANPTTDTIDERRDESARDFLLALYEDIHPPSITTDGARSILQTHRTLKSNSPGLGFQPVASVTTSST